MSFVWSLLSLASSEHIDILGAQRESQIILHQLNSTDLVLIWFQADLNSNLPCFFRQPAPKVFVSWIMDFSVIDFLSNRARQ